MKLYNKGVKIKESWFQQKPKIGGENEDNYD